jgi:hypothetical protein
MPLTPNERSLMSEVVRACRAIVRMYDRGDPNDLTTLAKFGFRVQVERAIERGQSLLDYWEDPDGTTKDTEASV